MLVSDVMTRKVVAIGPDTPIRDVQALMEQRNIRHFPILQTRSSAEPDALIGIVSDRDVRLVDAAANHLMLELRLVSKRDARLPFIRRRKARRLQLDHRHAVRRQSVRRAGHAMGFGVGVNRKVAWVVNF